MNKEPLQELSKKEWRVPFGDRILKIINSFSLTEKILFYFFVFLFFISTISLVWQVNKQFLVEVPDYGGSFTEGVIGSPRFINPLLAFSETDKDITSLVYSGLLKADANGTLIPDLAQSYTISDDGLTYTFVLKDKIYFHDGTKITTDDIVFTIEKAQDSTVKSPRKANWDGVKVTKIDDKTVTFTLKQPYSPFTQNLTLGILPKHIWKSAGADEFPFSQFNVKPIGSGPYKVDSIVYTSGGLPSEYHLTAFNEYSLGTPYITNIVIKSYQNEKDIVSAYKSGDIDGMHSISAKTLTDLKLSSDKLNTSPLPRVFGVFFNQNVQPVFVNKEVRQALNIATNKKEIIQSVLLGYGQTVDEPIPPKNIDDSNDGEWTDANVDKAKALLIANGWKQNTDGVFEKKDKKTTTTLAFSISTSDAPELKLAAEILQRQWQRIGARVDVKIFEVGDLNQNIIRPRKYDSLLFGEIIGRDMDLYPFWHSSQRNDPGLNIAMYTNLKADKILENIRKTSDPQEQQNLYDQFNKEINSDMPAVFIYSPYFIYVTPTKIHNIHLGQLISPSDRFDNIHTWYIETNKVWKLFAKNK
ncbi:MAG: ABC transporter substrate-binding protein [bacterium]